MTAFLTRRRHLIWTLFGVYAGFLFALTHWPHLVVEGPFPRPDLWAHFSFFGGWTAMACLSGPFGPPLAPANIRQSALLGLAYAAFDEGLQAIPALGRTCALDDYGANAVGVLGASLILLAISRLARRDAPAHSPGQ